MRARLGTKLSEVEGEVEGEEGEVVDMLAGKIYREGEGKTVSKAVSEAVGEDEGEEKTGGQGGAAWASM